MIAQELRLEDKQAVNVMNTVVWHKELIDPLLNACTPPELIVIATYLLSNLCVNYPQMYGQFVRVFTFMELLMKSTQKSLGTPALSDSGLINWFMMTPEEPLTERPDLICLFEGPSYKHTPADLPTVLM